MKGISLIGILIALAIGAKIYLEQREKIPEAISKSLPGDGEIKNSIKSVEEAPGQIKKYLNDKIEDHAADIEDAMEE